MTFGIRKPPPKKRRIIFPRTIPGTSRVFAVSIQTSGPPAPPPSGASTIEPLPFRLGT